MAGPGGRQAGRTLFRRVRLFDYDLDDYRGPLDVLVEGERIREVSEAGIRAAAERTVEGGGDLLMPGLIDAHVHVIGVTLDPGELTRLRPYLVAARAKQVLEGMLSRGFTTVRDAGGADAALAQAVAEGAFVGPRLFVSGLALAQTGGQGDFRAAGQHQLGCPICRGERSLTRLVDGVDQVRQAVRAELRDGADQIKVMASGGIASGIPPERCHFSREELEAMVDEAGRAGTYVMAHAYENAAVRRVLAAGVRSIEHGSDLDGETLSQMRRADAFLVPTLSAYDALRRHGPALGLGSAKVARFEEILAKSLDTLGRAHDLGVAVGHGSDLEGELHAEQSREFALKASALPAREVIRAATLTNARLLGREGELGVIAPGALADLLLVRGDPYHDAAVLADPGRALSLIMKGGVIHKDER